MTEAGEARVRAAKKDGSWALREPLQPRAMVLADDVLFLAGWRDAVAIKPQTGEAIDPAQDLRVLDAVGLAAVDQDARVGELDPRVDVAGLEPAREAVEIAQRLVISPNTVKKHASNIYGKLGVRNRRDAVAQAQEIGLLSQA